MLLSWKGTFENTANGADLLKMSKEDFIQICGPADGIRLFNAIKGRNVRPKMTVYVCQEPEQNQSHLHQKRENGDGNLCVYHAIFLEELTTLELMEKIANLYSISPQQINRIYRQGPTGIHVLVSNERGDLAKSAVSSALTAAKRKTNGQSKGFLVSSPDAPKLKKSHKLRDR
ncbi:UNVERIFIED_CONTAM: Transcription factor CP2-like protein 1 [Gekko kuhli]